MALFGDLIKLHVIDSIISKIIPSYIRINDNVQTSEEPVSDQPTKLPQCNYHGSSNGQGPGKDITEVVICPEAIASYSFGRPMLDIYGAPAEGVIPPIRRTVDDQIFSHLSVVPEVARYAIELEYILLQEDMWRLKKSVNGFLGPQNTDILVPSNLNGEAVYCFANMDKTKGNTGDNNNSNNSKKRWGRRFGKNNSFRPTFSDKTRTPPNNLLLLVFGLLASITFHVPVRLASADFRNEGDATMIITSIILLNSSAFISSLFSIIILLQEFPYKSLSEIAIFALNGSYMCLIMKISSPQVALPLLFISIFLLLVAAAVGKQIVTRASRLTAISTCKKAPFMCCV